MMAVEHPKRLALDEPAPLLRWLAGRPEGIDLTWLEVAEVWGLTAVAVLARQDSSAPLRVALDTSSSASRFAHAVGFDDVVAGRPALTPGEPGRTVKLSRVVALEELEPAASKISKLLLSRSEHEDTRRTIYFVLVELLRNVMQHSQDKLGGVVAAQLNDRGRNLDRPVIQVAVADTGIGIQASLIGLHPGLTDPHAALDKALWPHISGTFEEGLTGSQQNAGMGLFFIAEMAKLVAGRLLIASRGAALELVGDSTFEDKHCLRFLETGLGFEGTLVAFEMPAYEEQDYDAMIETIRGRARDRTPRRATHQWLSFEAPPPEAMKFIVSFAVEDTSEAAEFARKHLMPRLYKRKPIALDFHSIAVCTQSYLHALLFEPLRLAWALRTRIYIVNAQPAVRSTLELLQNYALGG